jgi:hypothetical protein
MRWPRGPTLPPSRAASAEEGGSCWPWEERTALRLLLPLLLLLLLLLVLVPRLLALLLALLLLLLPLARLLLLLVLLLLQRALLLVLLELPLLLVPLRRVLPLMLPALLLLALLLPPLLRMRPVASRPPLPRQLHSQNVAAHLTEQPYSCRELLLLPQARSQAEEAKQGQD